MVPLALGSLLAIRDEGRSAGVRSIVFMALCWLILFVSIRQLRAYWMLPVLPLVYISAITVLDKMKNAGFALAAFAVIIFLFQSVAEVREFNIAPYNELRNWVQNNISDKDSVYLVGYSVLKVPRSVSANASLKSYFASYVAEDTKYGFTYRHLKNWEELTVLRLLDMLIPEKGKGFSIIGYQDRSTDFEKDDKFLENFNKKIIKKLNKIK